MSKTKMNSLGKTSDEESTEKSVHVPSIELNNVPEEPTYAPEQDLDIVFIPNSMHEHFECVIGKHVFVDKPWAKISHKKIMDHLQTENSNSCFWKFRKKLEGVQNEHVLVGYKPFSSTDEEFLICTTDRAKQYVEETQMDREVKQKVERSVFRVPGPWDSKSSEKDIEEIKPVQTREKITYKWKLPSERLQAKAELEDSNSKSMKNDYVKLEPRPKEVFEISDVFTTDSSVQAVRKMVDREMQTIPRIKDNKCIQSVAVDEEMFQLQPLTKPDKALDEFLEKHVPNLVNELHYNELYDLYRDDYKLLKNENEKPIEQNAKVIKLLPGYQNVVSRKKFVSSYTWHPTIPGVFAVSYTVNSNALYQSVSLETPVGEISKSANKYEKYGLSYSDDENNQDSLSDQSEVHELVGENYHKKITSLLNKEYVRRMRTIQIETDEEKTHEQQCSQEINRQLRNAFIHHDPPARSPTHQEIPSENPGSRLNLEPPAVALPPRRPTETDNMTNLNAAILKELNDEISTYDENNIIVDAARTELNPEDGFSAEENGFGVLDKAVREARNSSKLTSTTDMNRDESNVDAVEHHDSDTESFYNIWGHDDEWIYGNKLRNTVRNIHRKFNQKHDREAREEKLFKLLKSEAKYLERKNKLEDMDKERMKLTKDMFDAGVMYQKLKSQLDSKCKKRRKSKQNKQHRAPEHHEELIAGQETALITDEQNNSVVIWSANDNIFPKLILECTEEVCCVEFNPIHGNIVVGGLKNGQICIWDITGKLENLESDDLNMTEKEKKHRKHLWTHMKWSLDVDFKTRIKPAALTAILESHESAVTAIQWIHPMNEITPLGKLVAVQEGRFSDQFFSASMDGTVRLWDLHSAPMQSTSNRKNPAVNVGLERPENLNGYKSPLSVYNNRLKPSYTIVIKEPENVSPSPITAMSFEIPLMRYKRISDRLPLRIGKRQFEYVPTTPDDPNSILVVGGITGQVGVITWTGHEKSQLQEQCQDKEDCKTVWWGHVHDGPINCIRRNVFYPDIHLVCGGHVVSIWSLNYESGPVWWKRFDDFTSSVLWSTVHPAEFRVSFNTGGVLQFWNFMKYTHQPYYTSDIFLSDGLIATLSAPRPPIHYADADRFEFAGGVDALVLDHGTNESIGFSDSAGTVTMIVTDATPAPGPAGIDRVGRAFQKEVDWRRELDAWNEKYREEFGGDAGDDDDDDDGEDAGADGDDDDDDDWDARRRAASDPQRDANNVFDEMFRLFSGRNKGRRTRLGKMRERYAEREKQYMIETLMKKKNVSQKQLEEHFKRIEGKNNADDDMSNILFEADETYKDIVNKLLDSEMHTAEKYAFDVDSKEDTNSENMKQTIDKIHQLLVTDCEGEKDKLKDFIKNNPFTIEQEDWDQVIEFAERQVRDTLNDPTLLKNPALRMMRRKLAKKYIDEGYKIKEWKSREEEHECDRYKIRESKIEKLKALYGKSYNPYWDKGLQPQKMKDAVQLRVTDAADQHYKRSHDFKEEDDSCYADYLSLMDFGPISSHQDQLGKELPEHDASENVTQNDLNEPNNSIWNTQNKDQEQSDIDYKEHHDLETLDEQDRLEDRMFSKDSNELNENNNETN